MSKPDFSIAILGAGPVGCALALMLARHAADPADILLVRGAPPAGRAAPSAPGITPPPASVIAPIPAPATAPLAAPAVPALPARPRAAAPEADVRVLAMNHGSRVLLESLGAWPRGTASIHTIHVSQRGRLGRTLIRDTDFDVPQLGAVTAYAALHAALMRQVEQAGITVRALPGARLAAQDADGVTLADADGDSLRCGVAVQSDGAGADDIRREYGQHAVLATVRAALPRDGWAFERFTREGPLALLPHPAAPDTYAVVWCCAPERAQALAALDQAAFSTALLEAFGDRLGMLACLAPRHVFPLFLSARRALVHGRTVAVGNAAQTLHPVAGQGLNLGLRDAARLAQSLASWLGRPAGAPTEALAAYTRARRGDRWLTAGLTDLMPRAFATGLAPLEHAGGLALLGLDLLQPLRAPLARHLLQGLRA
ncbi:FAD-dependent monooxygenase [Achromobacter aloeverae]|uniref:Monooxygenase n=1 Tax=Achromobacter aloeverae TaxID=1750518 RepID=A0A4Q1HCA9_9BURK|nr:FAD-dependent monooxygenase [Achromobacter aloeverae]RXN83288.1 monooxygenase [Achromobacter aloeverae]